jgi:ABC-type phosphonate transport system ATPase subunit
MSIRERVAIGARAYNADVLRQKAQEWVAKSAVNRIREDPEAA